MIDCVGAGRALSLRLCTEGVPDGEAAVFTLFDASDDSELETVEGKVEGDKALCTWTTPDLEEEGKETRRVYYKAKVMGNEVTSPEVEIYRDKATIISLDPDGEPLPDVPYTVVAGKRARHANTGSKGERTEEYLPQGKRAVHWGEGVDLIEWQEEGPVVWKAKLRRQTWFDVDILGILPEEWETDDVFVLTSDDGSFEQKKSVYDDQIKGDDRLTLRFTGIEPGKKYTLKRFLDDELMEVTFESVAYEELIHMG